LFAVLLSNPINGPQRNRFRSQIDGVPRQPDNGSGYQPGKTGATSNLLKFWASFRLPTVQPKAKNLPNFFAFCAKCFKLFDKSARILWTSPENLRPHSKARNFGRRMFSNLTRSKNISEEDKGTGNRRDTTQKIPRHTNKTKGRQPMAPKQLGTAKRLG